MGGERPQREVPLLLFTVTETNLFFGEYPDSMEQAGKAASHGEV